MSSPNENLKWFANILVKKITKEYKEGKKVAFFPLLAGIGSCKVEYRDYGHNSGMVVDAIHKYYDESKDEDIINGYEDGIKTMIKMSKNFLSVYDVLAIIAYECRIEKSGEAKFSFHKDEIIEYYNMMIMMNRGEILKNSPDFEEHYKEYVEYFKSKYEIVLF